MAAYYDETVPHPYWWKELPVGDVNWLIVLSLRQKGVSQGLSNGTKTHHAGSGV